MTLYKATPDGNVEMTPDEEAEITAMWATNEAAAETIANSYITQRQLLYPNWEVQADMMYHDMIDGTTKWRDLITSIKTQVPKN